MRYVDWKVLQKVKARHEDRNVPWWKTILTSSAVPILTALIGYGVGVMSEVRQQETYERRLYLEQRMKLFVSASTNFTGYLENLERLNTITASVEKTGKGFSKETRERRDRYEKDRTAARERLWADLEQAQLFFSPAVSQEVAAFKSFFEKHQNATLATMPPKSQYARYKDGILIAMRNEVRAEGK